MKKELPIFELKIDESITDESEVTFVSLVDSPAIQKDFLVFQKEEQFIEPKKYERKDEYLPRCISYEINEGKESAQAVAICNSKWEKHMSMEQEFAETYNDYPQAATENAKRALDWADKNGWGECGTPVGKIRANQLANRENISRETIARMAGFERHRQNSKTPYGEGCGKLMWDAWGGDEGIAWAQRKLQQIDRENFASERISIDYDDTLSTKRGQELAAKLIKEGNLVYIISARNTATSMYKIADELGIPHSRIYATGSNLAKIEKVKQLNIDKHYDNNSDVIKKLGNVGEKFYTENKFQIVSEEQKIISGALMLADELIYRNSPQFGEHYVKFTAETIKQIAIKFAKKKYQNNVNLMHDDMQIVDGVTMFESFIVDKSRGILPMVGFEDVADGSWFGSFYVENEDVWNKIKMGEFKGFSVEGLFEMIQVTPSELEEQELMEILEQINKLIDSNKI